MSRFSAILFFVLILSLSSCRKQKQQEQPRNPVNIDSLKKDTKRLRPVPKKKADTLRKILL